MEPAVQIKVHKDHLLFSEVGWVILAIFHL